MCINEYREALNLLYSKCLPEQKEKIDIILEYISNNLDLYGLVEVAESFLYAYWYHHVSQLISFPEKSIIVDCGCGMAIYQVFFSDFHKYIGIDCNLPNKEKFIINNNVELYEDLIQNALLKLPIRQWEQQGYNVIGISHLACSYTGGLQEFKNSFRYLISL